MMDDRTARIALLEWYADMGLTATLSDRPNNRLDRSRAAPLTTAAASRPETPELAPSVTRKPAGTSFRDGIQAATGAANGAESLEALRAAMANFDGHPLKKTAGNLVFADGSPDAAVMVVGAPPGSDEDRAGVPFSGANGRLTDAMFASVGLSRTSETPSASLYMTHIMGWRPPGNRQPTEEEIALSLPFIRRHIALVRPRFLVIMGGIAARALLETDTPLSRLRGTVMDYDCDGTAIPALVTYDPETLMNNPLHKRKVWQDMQALKDRINAAD